MSRPKPQRIHQDKKATVKALKIVKNECYGKPEEELKILARKRRNHRKACSCDLCCNPRKSKFHKGGEKLTIQEKKASCTEID